MASSRWDQGSIEHCDETLVKRKLYYFATSKDVRWNIRKKKTVLFRNQSRRSQADLHHANPIPNNTIRIGIPPPPFKQTEALCNHLTPFHSLLQPRDARPRNLSRLQQE